MDHCQFRVATGLLAVNNGAGILLFVALGQSVFGSQQESKHPLPTKPVKSFLGLLDVPLIRRSGA